MARTLTVVVTGSNRGIGRAIVQMLALTQHSSPLSIYASSRNDQALDIVAEHGNEVHYVQLDITDSSSIARFFQQDIVQRSGIDILINNAGINLDYNDDGQNPASRALQTLSVNYEATKNVCLAFLDSNKGGRSTNPVSRIVNLSSAAASLHGYSEDLQQRFRHVKSLSDVDALAKDYIHALSQSHHEAKKQGWHMPSYSVSKALINALTIVLANSPGSKNHLINCCDPGWVASDMGALVGHPPKTEEQGARIPLKLALGDLKGVSGRFWGNHDVSSTSDGDVLPW